MHSLFIQPGPVLANAFVGDRLLRSHLAWRVPPEHLRVLEPGLERLGHRAVSEVARLGDDAERNTPVHVPFDAWGRRVDELRLHESWRALRRIAVEEHLVSIAHQHARGRLGRVEQAARLFLYAPFAAIHGCPVAMTDGAARVLALHGDAAQKSEIIPRLTSDIPEQAWTSGQWMTERTGGSDVSGTTTVARLVEGGYRLYGEKWFASAIDADVALTLARIETPSGVEKGLSLFLVRPWDEARRLRGVELVRLKDKLGTRALPTAELVLDGVRAELVGGPGGGVKKISSLLNITRVHNAVGAVGMLRRGLELARSYASRRVVFGASLAQQSLHARTIAALAVEHHAAFRLAFHVAELLGAHETGEDGGDGRLLRILTPLVKLYTAKQTVAVTSEIVESFGGLGYVEDSGLPALFRNTQVLPIWEGTTNVLSLDVLRAIEREDAFTAFAADVEERLRGIREVHLREEVARVEEALGRARTYLEAGRMDSEGQSAGARQLAFALARIYAASLLLAAAQWEGDPASQRARVAVARRWCAKPLGPSPHFDDAARADDVLLAGFVP